MKFNIKPEFPRINGSRNDTVLHPRRRKSSYLVDYRSAGLSLVTGGKTQFEILLEFENNCPRSSYKIFVVTYKLQYPN